MIAQPPRKKIPPLVPKKKPGLLASKNSGTTTTTTTAASTTTTKLDSSTILLPNLKPRLQQDKGETKISNDNGNGNLNTSLEKLIDSISLETKFSIQKQRKNEPKPITLDEIMKPVHRPDMMVIKPKNEVNTVVLKSKPQLPPKPKILSSSPISKNSQADNTPEFLKETMQKRMKLIASPIPLPGLAKSSSIPLPGMTRNTNDKSTNFSSTRKSHTIDNSGIGNASKSLVYPNKSRSKGPKRRLPTSITNNNSNSSSNRAKVPSPSPSPTPTPIKKKSLPPPISKPSKTVQCV